MELGSGMVEVGVAEAKKERLNHATRERKYVTRVNLVQQRGRSVAAKHATRPFSVVGRSRQSMRHDLLDGHATSLA